MFRLEEQAPKGPAGPGKWIPTSHPGVEAEAGAYGYERHGETTVLPLVLSYGAGIKGSPHAYGQIQAGHAFVGKGLEDNTPPVDTGVVEPATRVWEQTEPGVKTGILTPDTEEPVRVADMPDNNDEMLEKLVNPRKVLKYTLHGRVFGRYGGRADLISLSEDGNWLGILYTPDDSCFQPPVNGADDDPYVLRAGTNEFHVRFTGIELPVSSVQRVQIFFKI